MSLAYLPVVVRQSQGLGGLWVVVFRLALSLVVQALARLVNSIKVVMGVARLVIKPHRNRD